MAQKPGKLDFLSCEWGGDHDPEIVAKNAWLLDQSLPKRKAQIWKEVESLRSLFSPYSMNEFSKKYVDRGLWISRPPQGEESRFRPMIDFDELERLCRSKAFRNEDVLVVDARGPVRFNDLGVSQPRIMNYIRKRHLSLWIDLRFDRYSDAALKMMNDLRACTQYSFGVHLLFTPKSSTGFRWHWDPVDTFIFQCDGIKDWTIDERRIPLPLPHHSPKHLPFWNATNAKHLSNFTLTPGMFAYLPAGFPHLPKTTEKSESVHLTFTGHAVTWHSLLKEWIQQGLLGLEFESAVRAGIPIGNPYSLDRSSKTQARRMLKKFISNLSTGALDQAYQKVAMSRFTPPEVRSTPPSAPHRKLTRVRYERTHLQFIVVRKSDYVEVRYSNRKLIFPDRYTKLLKTIERSTSQTLKFGPEFQLSSADFGTAIRCLEAHQLIECT